MQFTRDEMVAAEMALRNFEDLINPIFDELKSNDAKKGYAKSIFVGACAALSEVTGEDFEDTLDELVIMNKQIHKECHSKTHSKAL